MQPRALDSVGGKARGCPTAAVHDLLFDLICFAHDGRQGLCKYRTNGQSLRELARDIRQSAHGNDQPEPEVIVQ